MIIDLCLKENVGANQIVPLFTDPGLLQALGHVLSKQSWAMAVIYPHDKIDHYPALRSKFPQADVLMQNDTVYQITHIEANADPLSPQVFERQLLDRNHWPLVSVICKTASVRPVIITVIAAGTLACDLPPTEIIERSDLVITTSGRIMTNRWGYVAS